MSERNLTFFFILCLTLVIGVMSWRGMHPEKATAPNSAASYYINDKLPTAPIPDDNIPLTIAQGEFRYAQDGSVRFTHKGMLPSLFAQRQVNILLTFATMPKNAAETFSKIEALLQEWKHQGTTISVLFLDYRPPKTDVKAFTAFIQGLKKHFSKDPHVLIPVVDINWSETQDHQLLLEDIPTVLVDIQKLPPTLAQLGKLSGFKSNFQLRLPVTELSDDEIIGILPKTKFFGGYFLTLDTRKPLTKKSQTIGLFPKL